MTFKKARFRKVRGHQPSPAPSSVGDGSRGIRTAAIAVILPFWRTRRALSSYVASLIIVATLSAELWIALQNNEILGNLAGALVDRRVYAIWSVVKYASILLIADAINTSVFGFLRQFIMIRWRQWLVGRLKERWLSENMFYFHEISEGVDNPDQRISEDTLLLVDYSTRLLTQICRDAFRLVGFASLLLSLGSAIDFGFIGVPVTIPGALLLVAIIVATINTTIAYSIGRPLLFLRILQQRKDADLRFALIGVRANAEQIALYEGEASERNRVAALLTKISNNWHHIMRYQVRLAAFGRFQSQLLVLLMMVVGLQPYLRGTADFAHMTSVGFAFQMTMNGLTSILRIILDGEYYTWAAAVRRLDAFSVELSRPRVSGIRVTAEAGAHAESLLETRALILARPDGRVLASPGDLTFRAGERWLLEGESGAGKSTMLRAMAGLWPHGQGAVRFDPAARERTLFLPQKSYVPVGPLIDALNYPAIPGTFTPDACIEALRLVRLDGLVDNLDEDARWQERLSPGEQQRLAFVRVFLHEPEIILLDEATSALDPANENHLYSLLNERLPNALVISIAHRKELARYHEQTIRICAIG